MIYILIFLLILMILIQYTMNSDNILSVTLINLVLFCFNILMVILNRNWNYDISFKCFLYILVAMFSFFIGESLVKYTTKHKNIDFGVSELRSIKISKFFYIMSVIIITVSVLVYIREVMRIASSIPSLGSLFATYRHQTVSNGESSSIVSRLLSNVSECLAFTYLFLWIIEPKNKKYLIPIGLYLISCVFSTNRMSILIFMIEVLVFYFFIRIRPEHRTKKFIKDTLKVFIIGLLAFYLLGSLTQKMGLYNNIFENISMYTASSIPALDKFLLEYKYTFDNFGEETLWGINNLLKMFHIELFETKANFLPYVYFTFMGHATNIYTFIRRMVYDYGICGMILLCIFIAAIYTRVYYKIINKRYKHMLFALFMYTKFFYPIVIGFVDFKYFDIFSFTGVLQACILYWLTRYLEKNMNRNIQRELSENNII